MFFNAHNCTFMGASNGYSIIECGYDPLNKIEAKELLKQYMLNVGIKKMSFVITFN
jgi:hypothetical protein